MHGGINKGLMYNLSTYSSLSLIIIKSLRANKTQIEMSRILGKKYNIYHRWESGEQRIKLKDFLEILTYLEFDSHTIILRAFSIKYDRNNDLMRAFTKKHKVLNSDLLLKYLKISETSWWRILNQKRDIFLDEFLLFSNYQTQRLNILLQELGLNTKSNLLKTLDSAIEKFLLTYINNPELSVIGSAIYLKSVRVKKSKEEKLIEISLCSSYSLSHVKKIVKHLVLNDVLFWDSSGNLDFNYFANTFTTHREKEVFHSLKNYLIRHLTKKINTDLTASEKFHFRIAAVSNKANNLITEEIKICSQKVSSIIENDDPLTRIKVVGYMSTLLDF
jgi:hypothetical protein